MSDTSTPAGNSGGDTTTPIAAALAELPARIRVHALAKLLGRSSREVLAAVTELGADGRSVQSSIDRELALRVAEALGVTAPDPAAVDAAETAPAAEAPAQATGSAQPTGARQSGGRGSSAEPQSAGFRQAGGVQAPGFRQTTQQSSRQALVAGSPGFTAPSAVPPAPVQGESRVTPPTPVFASASPLFLPPEPPVAPPRPPRPAPEPEPEPEPEGVEDESEETEEAFVEDVDEGRPRRRRGRRGRGRGKGGQDESAADEPEEQEKPDKPEKPEKSDKPSRRVKAEAEPEETEEQEPADGEDAASRRRRRRRRRRGGDGDEATGNTTEDDPPNTVVHVREAREAREEKPESDGRDEVRSVRGSTRLEAKRQRRRDGREAGRRRAPILSEAEFLARREAVDRAMVIRERADRIQIGVLEDGVLVEHFVTSAGTGSLVGNVYLGRVQNVLPSMEAAFVDIGRGRNAVLYAGEVDWDAAGLEGKARKIEQALSTGDSVLVQVTKDPVGHKGARLTTQISLPGRFLVYVPGGGATGISRKLPENERRRLKDVLKRVVPEDAGVIIRTASEGISEEELARDVRRLQAQWQVIRDKTEGTNGVRKVGAPSLVYEEPDLLVKVVRDLFTEDFSALVIQGDIAWETVDAYVRHVAPELADRLRKHAANTDVFAEYRIDEQLLKALDRKVWLPSGGYLVIDRTEAMTVIDVNTGKFTGSGGNLEETVTRNNLESAEEIVRQLRLRDIGGIIVIDFIDMVLESNRDLVLRRLTECLGRDRTRHQVAEVTSLGLVQMTRKRVGTGLLEAFGTTCEHCKGRGVLVTTEPVSKPNGANGHAEPSRGGGNTRRSRGRAEEPKDQKDKSANKDAAKEAAAQAAKDAVRDIAKATTKTVDQPKADSQPQPADSQATAAESKPTESEPADAATAPEPSTRSEGHSRHRTRDRSRRSASRNGAPHSASADHAASAAGEPTTAPAHAEAEHTNGTATRSTAPTEQSPAPAEASAVTEPPSTGSAAPSGSAGSSGTTGASGSGASVGSVPAASGSPTGSAASAGSAEPAAAGSPTAADSLVGSPAMTGSTAPVESGSPTGPVSSAESTESAGSAGLSGIPSNSPSSERRPLSADTPSEGLAPSIDSAATDPETATPDTSAPTATPATSGTFSTREPFATSWEPASGTPDTAETSVTSETPAAPAATTSGTPGASAAFTPEAPASEVPTHERSASEVAAREGAAVEAASPEALSAEETRPEASTEEPSVPAPATPPRRQPRRAASRPAGPPVSARHDG